MNDVPSKQSPLEPSEIVSDVQDGRLSDLPGVEEKREVTPRDKLRFAKQILLGLGVLFLASFAMSALGFQEVFESCKEILPAIATLIIGYYFGAIK